MLKFGMVDMSQDVKDASPGIHLGIKAGRLRRQNSGRVRTCLCTRRKPNEKRRSYKRRFHVIGVAGLEPYLRHGPKLFESGCRNQSRLIGQS